MADKTKSTEEISRLSYNKVNSNTAGNLSMEEVVRNSYDPITKRLYVEFTGSKNALRVKPV